MKPELPSAVGEPAWEVATLFPSQGEWKETDFFRIHTNHMAELVNGKFEILPMPTWLHQLMVVYFLDQLRGYLKKEELGGIVLIAPLPVRLFPGTIREPDVLYVLPEHIPLDPRGYPECVDFVVEIVSEGAESHQRDYHDKRSDYAKGGVSEYWIVDPETETISVLKLENKAYAEKVFRVGQIATSEFLTKFSVDV